jgi:hypothetical protein
MTPTMQNVIPPALTPVDAFTLGEISCQRLCLLLKQWSGVCVDASKAYLIQGRLRGLMAKEQLSDLTDLLDRAERPANAELRNRIVDMMTTHETLFTAPPAAAVRNRTASRCCCENDYQRQTFSRFISPRPMFRWVRSKLLAKASSWIMNCAVA